MNKLLEDVFAAIEKDIEQRELEYEELCKNRDIIFAEMDRCTADLDLLRKIYDLHPKYHEAKKREDVPENRFTQ